MDSINSAKENRLKSFLKIIGPGLLLAGAAIGVSHVVQATRAGADYGFALIWVLILGCVSKYPFMEFAPRYLGATGEDLITGYKKISKKAYWIYFWITVGTMFIIQAAIAAVTAGVAEELFQLGWSPFVWGVLVLSGSILLLLFGKYTALDGAMKLIIVTLTIATLIAVGLAFSPENYERVISSPVPSYWNVSGFLFLIAFMGWMPIPIDASVWHTLWIKESARVKNRDLTIKDTLADFNTGYLSASILGLFFLFLGALMMFGTGESFSTNSVAFSTQLIGLYKTALGSWSAVVMAIAVFITLLSTLLTVVDIYPRVMERYIRESQHPIARKHASHSYMLCLIGIPVIAMSILYLFGKSFTALVDFAASLSFVATAMLAWFNYRLVTQRDFPKHARPGRLYRIFSLICLMILVVMALAYIYVRIIS